MSEQDLATIAVVVAGLALAAGIIANLRIASAHKSLTILQGTHDGKTLIDAVANYVADVRKIEGDLRSISQRQEELFSLLGRSARNLGLVRFDAFEDMGGMLSFSAAILDDHGRGLVLTSINGRAETRVYAKPVEKGGSTHNLSPEELEAMSEALGGAELAERS